MWYSTLFGYETNLWCEFGGCTFENFAISGDTVVRNDQAYDYAVSGGAATLSNLWIEHIGVGYWAGPNADGLHVSGCRFRNLFADGVNLWKGTSNAVVENSHARNTGDDAFANFAATQDGHKPSSNNTFRDITVQGPWQANCFGLYGGGGNRVEDSVCADVLQYPGVLLARQFGSYEFGETTLSNNTLIRAGGDAYDQPHGALKFHGAEGPISNIHVSGLEIVDATHFGIQIQGPGSVTNTFLNDVRISTPGVSAFWMNVDANGSARLDEVRVISAEVGISNHSEGQFSLEIGEGNSGF
jgi:hypothetical protein